MSGNGLLAWTVSHTKTQTCGVLPSGSFICDFSYFSTRVSHMLWNTIMQIIGY